MQGQIDTLREALPKLAERDRAFADSLLDQWSRRGLSENQMAWVTRLIDRASQPEPEAMQIGSVEPIVALIQQARSRLKWPAILLGDGETELRVSVAGPQSKSPGAVNVTSIERGADGKRSWFGRIQPNGRFEPAARLDRSKSEKIATLLVQFAAAPAAVAASYGHRTGHCCFCNIKLDDERSTSVGYGRTCAKNWGVPWGWKAC
jgi:hypothetical protein